MRPAPPWRSRRAPTSPASRSRSSRSAPATPWTWSPWSTNVLNVRAASDPQEETLGELDPLGGLATLTGRAVSVSEQTWAEIEGDDGVGWVASPYLGAAEEVTEDYSDLPAQQSEAAVADAVAEEALAQLPELDEEDAVLVRAVGDSTEEELQVLDFAGLPDDSVRGDRLVITVGPEAGEWEVTEVEATPICHRGVSEEGLCL